MYSRTRYNLKSLLTFLITLFVCFFLILIIAFTKRSTTYTDAGVMFTFAVSIAISLISLVFDQYNFSLNKTFWLFNLIFFGFTPLVQYLANASLWGYVLNDSDYLKTNLLIVFSQAVYLLIRYFCRRRCDVLFSIRRGISKEGVEHPLLENSTKNLALTFVAFGSFFILGMLVGFGNLFVRSTNSIAAFSDGFMNDIVSILLRAAPVYCFVFAYKNSKRINIWCVLIFLAVIACNWPMSTTRYLIGAIYIGFLLLIFQKLDNKRLYDLFLIGLLCVLFPLFQSYKNDGASIFNVQYDLFKAFNNVDFDAYSILARAIHYVEAQGSVHGGQIIGTLFFFVPRKIWPGKPEASGQFLASYAGQSFGNISCPFVAEALLNFGIFGVVLFLGALSYVTNKVDYKYWNGVYEDRQNNFRLMYPFVMGLYVYILRGALHVTAIYTFLFLFPLIVIRACKTIRTRMSSRIKQE